MASNKARPVKLVRVGRVSLFGNSFCLWMSCQVYRRNLSVGLIMFPFKRRASDSRHDSRRAVNCRRRGWSAGSHLPAAYGLNIPGGLIENSVSVDRRKTPSASKRSVVYKPVERGCVDVGRARGDRRGTVVVRT